MALADDTVADTSWRIKADKELLNAYDGGTDALRVVLLGPDIPQPTEPMLDRAMWKAYWTEQSAPFLAQVRDLAARLGATVTNEVPAVNAAFVQVQRERVPDLLRPSTIRLAGLDWQGATFIVDEEQGPGVQATLDQTIAKVQATQMWALGYRGEGISLAVIDTGVRPTHEMFKKADGTSRVTKWHDTTEPPSGRCATACDTHSHGTHVGTTAAGSNLFNPTSQQGVAPRAEIYGVRIFQGGGGSWEDAQEGLQAAFDMGAEITTNSWGGGCSGGGDVTALLAETLQNAGMINVFAAGNSGAGGVLCPGVVENVLTVGGIDVNDNIYGSSSRGPCVWPLGSGNSRICPDVNAVAVDVVAGCHSSDTCYTSFTGTSMATPHVAGVVVMLQQAHKALKGTGMDAAGKQAEILLRYSAKDLGPIGPDNDFGWGTAQALAAYNLLNSGAPLNLRHLFSIGLPVMRAYNDNGISFSVVNLGSVAVTGPMTLEIKQVDTGACPPTCVNIRVQRTANLGPFTEAALAYSFDGETNPAGNYLVTATLPYTYSGGSGLISETGSFLLKKVSMQFARAIPGETTSGSLLMGGWELRNVGNENATNVRYTERFAPQGLVPAGAVPPGVGPYGLFANPAPTNVNLAARITPTPESTYTWADIGEIKFGSGWEAQANFVAGAPGSYAIRGTLNYADETGTAFSVFLPLTLEVSAPGA